MYITPCATLTPDHCCIFPLSIFSIFLYSQWWYYCFVAHYLYLQSRYCTTILCLLLSRMHMMVFFLSLYFPISNCILDIVDVYSASLYVFVLITASFFIIINLTAHIWIWLIRTLLLYLFLLLIRSFLFLFHRCVCGILPVACALMWSASSTPLSPSPSIQQVRLADIGTVIRVVSCWAALRCFALHHLVSQSLSASPCISRFYDDLLCYRSLAQQGRENTSRSGQSWTKEWI